MIDLVNFTEEIKSELIGILSMSPCCRKACLASFIKISGHVEVDGNFEITTENREICQFFYEMITKEFNIQLSQVNEIFDTLSSKIKYNFRSQKQCYEFLNDIQLIYTNQNNYYIQNNTGEQLIAKDCCAVAFLIGCFLGGGSCTIPDRQAYSSTGYHIEFSTPNKLFADEICNLLCDFEILAKLVVRKENYVVYAKSMDVISDILALFGVEDCLQKLNEIVDYKSKVNQENRARNCSVSNIDKTVTASVNQVKAIEIIRQTIGLKKLNRKLFEVCMARLADVNASMQELADRLGISKSCLSHRMRKIIELAETLLQE